MSGIEKRLKALEHRIRFDQAAEPPAARAPFDEERFKSMLRAEFLIAARPSLDTPPEQVRERVARWLKNSREYSGTRGAQSDEELSNEIERVTGKFLALDADAYAEVASSAITQRATPLPPAAEPEQEQP